MSIRLRSFVSGPFETNCYIIWDQVTSKAVIVDPGGGRGQVISIVTSANLHVEMILLTHGHPDHSFYAGSLAEHYSVGIAMHEADIPQLTESLPIAEMFYDMSEYVSFEPSRLLNNGDTIQLGQSKIEVIHAPGHTPGGLCFLTDAGVLCGDTVFAGSRGRTDLPGGSYGQLMDTIKNKILTLSDNTHLYPGHGPSTTVGKERRTNPSISEIV